ncbi:chemotaxis protein CheW [Alicyclobacillus fastidiosus]|uniref:Chemotaxis protein CheW n=1 Tax=Alicyclobacillus fastidiosus TaxID=392011 RepID=A0ABV5AGQ2_9BACL|nr:chemotaxis protein CheW [Alicyclobacillus fastidiosus]WEH07908.1 chemotaxis protein CheW [Alicyclobacillus fastidiosus]
MAELQCVTMKIGEELYGAKVEQVLSVERMLDISPVPRTLSYIKGVANLRGTVTPVIDLRERVGLSAPSAAAEESRRIVVVEVDDMTVGLIVDAVEDVVSLDESAIEPAPAVVGGLQAVYLEGVARVGERLLVLLNLERILSDVEVAQLHEVEKQVHG